MGRPKKSASEVMENQFFDMGLAEQDAMLRTLELLHRMKARQASKRLSEPEKASEQPLLDGVPE